MKTRVLEREQSAIENPDRNQSDSICIMEKARDNVCTGFSARARFLFRLFLSLFPPQAVLNHFSFSLPLPFLSLSFALLLFSIPDQQTRYGLVRMEPKSLLMGSFGFDHRLTFPFLSTDATSPFACPCFISPSLIYSFSFQSLSNRYRLGSFHPSSLM